MPSIDIENPENLRLYLKQSNRVGSQEGLTIRKLDGGVSNRTVLVERANGSWVIKQALEKLRVPVDWFSDPMRIHLEALGLRWLSKFAPQGTLPEFVFEDHTNHIFAMTAIAQPHDNWKTLLLQEKIDFNHFEQFGNLLGTIHREGTEHREEVAPHFQDRSFFESLRLEPFYSYVAQQIPQVNHFLTQLIDDTRATQVTLVHGDYSPKNILIHQNRLVLLDHEVIHYGDPAFDLGFSLAHFLSKAHYHLHCSEVLLKAVSCYWKKYQEQVDGLEWQGLLEERVVRHTLGCLLARVAGRSQVEYLSVKKKEKQKKICLKLMALPPSSFSDCLQQFHQEIT